MDSFSCLTMREQFTFYQKLIRWKKFPFYKFVISSKDNLKNVNLKKPI